MEEVQAPERRGGLLARLPFRAGVADRDEGLEGLLRKVRSYNQKADVRQIRRDYEYAERSHHGQVRKSGEPFIEHPLGVTHVLADLGMDTDTLVAGLLHDVVEDTTLGLEDVEREFGSEVTGLVDGVTKLDRIPLQTREQQQAENVRKMIVAMARDIRVLIIKLADRLHNMRTIGALDPQKRELIGAETLEIYAPLAHRLGMQQIRAELEDLSFRAMHPKRFQEIRQMVSQRQPEREQYLRQVIADVNAKLREARIRGEVSGRPKHYYSIYEKMVGRER